MKIQKIALALVAGFFSAQMLNAVSVNCVIAKGMPRKPVMAIENEDGSYTEVTSKSSAAERAAAGAVMFTHSAMFLPTCACDPKYVKPGEMTEEMYKFCSENGFSVTREDVLQISGRLREARKSVKSQVQTGIATLSSGAANIQRAAQEKINQVTGQNQQPKKAKKVTFAEEPTMVEEPAEEEDAVEACVQAGLEKARAHGVTGVPLEKTEIKTRANCEKKVAKAQEEAQEPEEDAVEACVEARQEAMRKSMQNAKKNRKSDEEIEAAIQAAEEKMRARCEAQNA